MMNRRRSKPDLVLSAFYLLALGLTWAWWLPLAAIRVVVGPGLWPTHAPGLVGPALAAVIVIAVTGHRSGLHELARRLLRWRIGLLPFVAIVGLPVLFVIAAVLEGRLGERLSAAELGTMNGFPVVSPMALWLLLVVVNGFGEEIGWRGFAFDRLRQRHGVVASSLCLVPVWAVWHLPSFFLLETYQGFGPANLVGFFLGLTCGAIVLGWIYERSGRSVLAAALWHGTFNLLTGTRAARGLPAAVLTTAVMVLAGAIVVAGWRRRAPAPAGPSRAVT